MNHNKNIFSNILEISVNYFSSYLDSNILFSSPYFGLWSHLGVHYLLPKQNLSPFGPPHCIRHKIHEILRQKNVILPHWYLKNSAQLDSHETGSFIILKLSFNCPIQCSTKKGALIVEKTNKTMKMSIYSAYTLGFKT